MKRNITSLVMNIISIIIYSLLTFFLVFLIIDAVKNYQPDGNVSNLGLAFVIILLATYGTIGYGVATVFSLLALIFALVASPKKTSRIVLSVLFLVLPYLTEIISIIILQVVS